jgi:predicted permease
MLELTAKLIILATIIIIALWDISVVLMGRPETTISAVLLQLAKENPIIAFTMGVVIGHLFWPNFRQ